MQISLAQKALAEWLGTVLLLATVIGSGVMAERLCGGNAGLALLANTAATVGALYVLIEIWPREWGAFQSSGELRHVPERNAQSF